MTDKQIIGGRGSAKPYTTLNTIEVMLENEDLKEQLKRKEQECERLKEEQTEIKKYLGISSKTILERLEELTEFRDSDRDEIFQLKEQLDQLKAENEQLKNFHINLVGVKECEIRELARYKQAIEKIKDYCNKYPQNSIGFKQQILQICDEVNQCENQ